MWNPNQPRDRLGRWTDGAGVLRAVTANRAEAIRPRGSLSAVGRRIRLAKIRDRARSISAGTAPREMLEYAHPRQRAEALRTTGTARMPVREAIQREVSLLRPTAARRAAVAVNPFSGRYVGVEGDSERPRLRGSAIRRRTR